MKALLPVYCRPLGYVILIVALFLPFILVMMGKVTDTNLLFYKECTKLLMIVGALMILLLSQRTRAGRPNRYVIWPRVMPFSHCAVCLWRNALSGGYGRFGDGGYLFFLDFPCY